MLCCRGLDAYHKASQALDRSCLEYWTIEESHLGYNECCFLSAYTNKIRLYSAKIKALKGQFLTQSWIIWRWLSYTWEDSRLKKQSLRSIFSRILLNNWQHSNTFNGPNASLWLGSGAVTQWKTSTIMYRRHQKCSRYYHLSPSANPKTQLNIPAPIGHQCIDLRMHMPCRNAKVQL